MLERRTSPCRPSRGLGGVGGGGTIDRPLLTKLCFGSTGNVEEPDFAARWAFDLARYHYLGLHVVGENLGYLACDTQGRDLGCLLFGAAAWRGAPRDRFPGWTDSQRRERLPHLASYRLDAVARRIAADWHAKYGHGLDWLETFVERGRFAGTCYRAANWLCVGQTRGRSRQDRDHTTIVPVKDVYLYRLRGGGR